MIGRTNVGGGSGGTGATLVVSAPADVTVTATKDSKIYTRVANSDGIATFKGLSSGTWALSMSDSSHDPTTPVDVIITADYYVTLAFFSATISIKYPVGSTCKATHTDGTELTAPDTSGTWSCIVPSAGTWSVMCYDGADYDSSDNKKSASVEITSKGQSESVELSYALYIIENGVLNSDGFYANASGSTVASKNYFKISQSSPSPNHSWGYFGPVDLTGYNTLILHVPNNVLNFSYYGSGSSNYGGCGFGVLKDGSTPTQETTTPENYYVSTTRFSNPYYNKKYVIDVPELTGTYYVAFDFAPSGSEQYGAISNFYLE